MGWSFSWISSNSSDFNMDLHVSFPADDREEATRIYNYVPFDGNAEELPGVSVFSRGDGGEIFHTYSAYARGIDVVNGAYQLLDMTPNGRGEDELDYVQQWIRRHDEYHTQT